MTTAEQIELSREVNGLKNDRIMTKRMVESQQKRWSTMLNGCLGKDIEDTLNGKKKVKLPFKYRLNKLIDKILTLFNGQEKNQARY